MLCVNAVEGVLLCGFMWVGCIGCLLVFPYGWGCVGSFGCVFVVVG